jgi:hypothetical protein
MAWVVTCSKSTVLGGDFADVAAMTPRIASLTSAVLSPQACL